MIVRTEEERQTLREGGKILGVVLAELAERVKPGVASTELEDYTRARIKELGGEPAFLGYRPEGAPRPYPAALCLSVNDVVVHGIPNEHEYVIQSGDIVTVDSGVLYNGLYTDAARTVIAGKPQSPEDVQLIAATEEALSVAVKMAKAGTRLGDIGAAIEAVAVRNGFGIPEELGGHGIGHTVHEDPFVANYGRPGTGPELQEGQVIAIEPIFAQGDGYIIADPDGYTIRMADGSRSAQSEHTVIVGKDGGEIVTQG